MKRDPKRPGTGNHAPTRHGRPSTAASFPSRLARARAGRPEAIGSLCRLYRLPIERRVQRLLNRGQGRRRGAISSRFSSADIVQDVFSSLLTSLKDFRGTSEGEFVTFVCRLAERRVRDALRYHGAARRDYRQAVPLSEASDRPASAHGLELPPEGATPLDEALAQLPKAARLLIDARLRKGATFTTLAKDLGFPSRYAARRAYFQARAKLETLISPLP